MPKLELAMTKQGFGSVKLDGVELPDTVSVALRIRAGHLTEASIDLLGTDVEFAGEAQVKVVTTERIFISGGTK